MREGGRDYACIAERRMGKAIRSGQALTPFLAQGDRVRIAMLDAAGASIFGAIGQAVI